MSDVLQAWKEKARADVVLPSGTKVTLRLPDMQNLVIAGEIPLPVLTKIERGMAHPEEMSAEDVVNTKHFQQRLLQLSVVAVEGQSVELTEKDVAEIPADDREEIVAYAIRSKSFRNGHSKRT